MQNMNHTAIRQTALIILSLALLFCAACAPAPGQGENGQPYYYPFNDDEVLDYIGMPLASIETEQGTVIFNEITDIEAYRAFNTAYGYQNKPYYSTRTTALDLVMQPVNSEDDFLAVSVFHEDGRINNKPDFDEFRLLQERVPQCAGLIERVMYDALAPSASAYYYADLDASGFIFHPETNCIATVVIAKDLVATDERFTHILPFFQKTLGTESSSIIGDQEIAVHHFYQNRLCNESEAEEAYQYYAYYEKDDLQYLYQFSSNWALIGQDVGALHNPPAVHSRGETQEECRELFLECLLTLVHEKE